MRADRFRCARRPLDRRNAPRGPPSEFSRDRRGRFRRRGPRFRPRARRRRGAARSRNRSPGSLRSPARPARWPRRDRIRDGRRRVRRLRGPVWYCAMKQSGRNAMAVVLAIGATLVLILIVLNLSSGEKKIKHQIEPLYAVGDPQFLRSMGSLLGPAVRAGNRVGTLLNGDQIFPAMLEAIRGAKKTIAFETYIYWSGDVGQQFADALSERARAGVKVHVLLDWVGSGKAKKEYLDEMRDAGVEVEKYHPLRWYNLSRINNRTHRKLLVVDGRVGFTGGVGIADKWSGNAQDPEHWRDSHFQLEGPAVAQMQAAFMDNWMKTQSKVLHGEEYFPELEPAGSSYAQVFKSS